MRLKTIWLASACAAVLCASAQANIDKASETQAVEQWRTTRVNELTSETGWLTLVGLFWLDPGENSFGRGTSNKLVLAHPALPENAGSFVVNGQQVSFKARPDSGITHAGQKVTTLDLVDDTQDDTTVLSSGPLRFFAIQRSGKIGVRVRDTQSPLRTHFKGLEYFDIDPSWRFTARFEPYTPHKSIKIMDILGLERTMDCWGAIVFTRGGQEYRLDAVLEAPGDPDLFVMFADGTSGRETYGAGRFMHVPFPAGQQIEVDFNKSYNPPCAFNDFATCPLAPAQNRLKLRIEAGEKTYSAH